MGASEELPLGSHFSSPVSGSVTFSSEVLQHNNAAKREDLTPKSELASVPVLLRLKLPIVGSKPLPVTLYATPPDHILTIVIFPSVSVPVLSLQTTEADPKVSTAANFPPLPLTLYATPP